MAQSSKMTNDGKKSTSEHPVSDRLKNTLHDSVDTLSDKAAQAEERIRETAQASSQTLDEKQKELKAKWEGSPVKKYASENPVATAGIAFAAGMLLSSFLKRK